MGKFLWSPRLALSPLQLPLSNSLKIFYFTLNSCTSQSSLKIASQNPFHSQILPFKGPNARSMQKNEIGFYDGVNWYSSPLLVVFFFSPSWLLPSAKIFLTYSYSATQLFSKKKLNLSPPRFEPTPCQSQINSKPSGVWPNMLWKQS